MSNNDIFNFPEQKIGEWIQIDRDTHFMPVAFVVSDVSAMLRGIVQVETEQGYVALCETHVPLPLVMRWIEEDD